MSKRIGSSISVASEHVQRRKASLRRARAARNKAMTLVPLLLSLAKCDDQPPKPEDPRDEMPTVIFTVTYRRNWLHTLREDSGQDCWLLDYTKADPELTLDWTLFENVSIESNE